MYQYAWGCASLSLLLVGWALWRTGADVVECAGDEEEFAPAATMVSLSIAGVLYVLAAACVLSAAALHLFSNIGIRAFLSLGVIGYNICMAAAGLLVQLTALGSLGEIKGTLWFRAAFLIAWMFGVWWFGERHKNATTLVLLTNSVVLMANAQARTPVALFRTSSRAADEAEPPSPPPSSLRRSTSSPSTSTTSRASRARTSCGSSCCCSPRAPSS